MVKGFNTDLMVRGQSFHVQSEDWGRNNPFLVSRVFKNGAVVKTLKISHEDAILRNPNVGSLANSQKVDEAIQTALKIQHQRVIELLNAGQLLY